MRLALVFALGASLACSKPSRRPLRGDAQVAAVPVVVDWGPAPTGTPAPPSEPMAGELVAVSPDGRLVASVERETAQGFRTFLRLREPSTLAVQHSLPLCLAGDPDHRALVECPTQRYPRVQGLAFAPDASAVAIACVGCAPGEAFSLHVVELEGRLRVARPLDFEPMALGWGSAGSAAGGSSAGSAIAVGGWDKLLLVDESGRDLRVLPGAALAVAPDASAYVAAGKVVWLRDGKESKLSSSSGTTVVPHADGYALVDTYSVKTYDRDGRESSNLWAKAGSTGARATRDGRFVAAMHHDDKGPALRLVDTRERTLVIDARLDKSFNIYRGYDVGPGGQIYLASASEGVTTLRRPAVPVALTVSPDGKWLAALEPDGAAKDGLVLRLRDTASLADGPAVPVGKAAGALAFSPDGGRVAVGVDASVVIVADGKLEQTLALPFAPSKLVWGAAGLAVLGAGHLATLNPATGKLAEIAHALPIESLAPDLSRLCVRDQRGAYEEPMPGGGHAWISPPARIACAALGGDPETVVKETQGNVVALAGGAWLLADGSAFELHDGHGKTRRVEHEFAGGPITAATPDGRWVVRVDGNYVLTLYDLQAPKPAVLTEHLSLRPSAVAVAATGTVFVGLAGRGTLALRLPP